MWLLFDAVGTLIYPDPPVAAAYGAAGRQFGSRLDEAEISRRFRAALQAQRPLPTSEALERERWRRIVAGVFDDVAPADQSELFRRLWEHFAQPRHWRMHPDAAPAIAELAAAGYRLGIASNFDSRLLRIVRATSGLERIERVFVSSEVGFVKPDPRFFAAIERALGVGPEQIALVGDDWQCDVVAARAAGWRALWLNREADSPQADGVRSLAETPPWADTHSKP